MATWVILEGKTKSDTVGQVKELLEKRLPETRAYEGCQSLTPCLSEDGRTLVVVQVEVALPRFHRADTRTILSGTPNRTTRSIWPGERRRGRSQRSVR